MRVLFTGGSSFTGYAFIKALSAAGHEVHATFTASAVDRYEGIRRERVRQLMDCCNPVWECRFGQEKFVDLINGGSGWDVFCHHAANAIDYKSLDFDVGRALSENTLNIRQVLEALEDRGCGKVVLTGSVFEQNEGVGEQPLRAFSPYGLSKTLTADVFRYWCAHYGLSLGKFVIPNPFGPYEEPRFTTYLARTWLEGGKAVVKTPSYVRDNIHVSLLALAYRDFVSNLPIGCGFVNINPSGYIETQGAFAQRFALAMGRFLQVPCELDFEVQSVFQEPKVRVNYDLIDTRGMAWSEGAAWEELAAYYGRSLKR